MKPTTAERVRAIIAESLGVDVKHDAEQLNSDLRCDSLDVVEIVMAIEEDFGIELPDYDEDTAVNEHSTVGHVIAVVERLVAAKAGA
jgi:acyl carrier protein